VPSNGAKDQTRILNEARCWQLRQRGYSQRRIADELGLDQGTVCRMLRRVERREFERLSRQVDRHKATQTAILEGLVDEAIQAWERSKGRRSSARRSVKHKFVEDEHGKVEEKPAASVNVTETIETAGDVAYLDRAMEGLRQIRKIWGLDAAPTKADAGPTLTYSDIAARLEANAAAFDSAQQHEAQPPANEPSTGHD
jgi:predicted transcriptional regulator